MRKLIYLLVVFAGVLFLSFCTESLTDNKTENSPPETSLFLFPDTGISRQPSRLTVNWWGDDPDGIVIGYYFNWNNSGWIFTTENDSSFALQIGASDTNYVFSVAAVDAEGNGMYDSQIIQNEINFGPEPFKDNNGNGVWDEGEFYWDIGLIDPTPAVQKFPIKNSAPEISWSDLSSVPSVSFPVMTFQWNASDLDGDESIVKINVALNDTNNYVSIDGNIRLITIRTSDFTNANPEMDIFLNGDPKDPAPVKLPGLKYDDFNRIYIQAQDISGATSEFAILPDSGSTWYVKKPLGNILVIDDYITADNSADFYTEKFDSLYGGALQGKYDTWDLHGEVIPFQTITFRETIKLFKGIFWYSDNAPSLDLASATVQDYIVSGKIAFSMALPRFIDQDQLRSFLPIDSTDSKFTNSLIAGAEVVPANPDYPPLKTTLPIFIIRSFYPSTASADPVYNVVVDQSGVPTDIGVFGFHSNDNKIFFTGLPLHKCDGYAGNVRILLDKVFAQDFGITP